MGAGAVVVVIICFSIHEIQNFFAIQPSAAKLWLVHLIAKQFLCKKMGMKIIVCTNESLKDELLASSPNPNAEIVFVDTIDDFFTHSDADGYIDLLFDNSEERKIFLKKIEGRPVMINYAGGNFEEFFPLVCINAWPSFLKREIVEAVCSQENLHKISEQIFACFHKKIEWIANEPAFISVKIISAIINEAYFALEENVSTKQEIDTAMKLGTNYPYGPFEWATLIGKKRVAELLNSLAKTNSAFQPAKLLLQEAR
ncbi:MAG: hypothetical protein C4308_06365 [Chitinophagaceae bacterium]